MKTRLLFALGIITATALFATVVVPYDNSRPPRLSLPDAYGSAIKALGTKANEFHCIKAEIATSFSDGEWFFTFYSTNSKPKWITVEFNGKIHVEDVINR